MGSTTGASSAAKKQAQGGSSISNKRKMRILPLQNQPLDYASVGGAPSAADPVAMAELEEQNAQRNQSIESVEKSLYDILGLFKRFGTIV